MNVVVNTNKRNNAIYKEPYTQGIINQSTISKLINTFC